MHHLGVGLESTEEVDAATDRRPRTETRTTTVIERMP